MKTISIIVPLFITVLLVECGESKPAPTPAKLKLQITLSHMPHIPKDFAFGSDPTIGIEIRNLGPHVIEASETFWATVLILDGREHQRLPQYCGDWNGPGRMKPDLAFWSGITFSCYGVTPKELAPGRHSVKVKIWDSISNELLIDVIRKPANQSLQGTR